MRVALIALVLSLWIFLVVAFVVQIGGEALDDFFITYRYAQNLAAGRGLVFNPGERVFGTTAPGLALLLAALHLVTRIPIHWAGTLLTAIALLGIGLMLLREAEESARLPEALAGGTLLMASTFLWGVHGAETHLLLAFLLLAAHLIDRRPATAGVLAGWAVWLRPDAVIGAGLLGLLLLGRRSQALFRYSAAVVVVVILGAGLAYAWFGELLPQTWAAKRAAAGDAETAEITSAFAAFWAPSAPLLRRHLGDFWPLVLGAGALGLWPLSRLAGLPGKLLAMDALALALIYPFLGVSFASWYVVPVIAAVLYGLAFAVGTVARGVAAWVRRPLARALLALVTAAVLLAVPVRSIAPKALRWYRGAGNPLHHSGYRAAGEWIRDHSAHSASIAFVEVGTLAYYSDRIVEDLMGLVTPRSQPYVAAGDLEGAFLAQPTEFVLVRPGLEGFMGQIVTQPWFNNAYHRVLELDGGTHDWTVIYRRRDGAALPPPRPVRSRPRTQGGT